MKFFEAIMVPFRVKFAILRDASILPRSLRLTLAHPPSYPSRSCIANAIAIHTRQIQHHTLIILSYPIPPALLSYLLIAALFQDGMCFIWYCMVCKVISCISLFLARKQRMSTVPQTRFDLGQYMSLGQALGSYTRHSVIKPSFMDSAHNILLP